jgi:hypothetical protein
MSGVARDKLHPTTAEWNFRQIRCLIGSGSLTPGCVWSFLSEVDVGGLGRRILIQTSVYVNNRIGSFFVINMGHFQRANTR